ncbi:MAG: beta-lactamase family protein [Bacteroidales bacterium]|nr:beta-lactamase family protein [Bacteroidales bacterium]
MNLLYKRVCFLAIGLILFNSQNLFSQEELNIKLIESNVDWFFTDFVGDKPGIVVSVMKQGDIVFNKAYGYSNIESKVKMTTDKAFNLAALSKTFTSVAILKLAEKKKLSLEDNLTDIFKDFPEYGKKVKIKNLLNHTSGLKNYNLDQIKNNKEVLDFLKSQDSLVFEPNTQQKYSNADYSLLAQIIEKESKKSYKDYLRKIFFKKYALGNTFLTEDLLAELVATPYFRVEKEYESKSVLSNIYGEQGIYTNSSDYLKWASSLYENKIISSENVSKMFSLQDLNELSANNSYAYGWVIMQRNGEKYYWHAGTDFGYSNLVLYLPDYEITVLLLSNKNDGSDYLRTAIKIAKQFEKDLKL